MSNIKNCIDIVSLSHKTLFILCGFPYAGKSYVANQITSQADVTYVSIDNVFSKNDFNWNENKLPNAEEWKTIFNESYEQIQVALRGGKNVLFDSTNQTLASRDTLRNIAKSVGANTKVIYIKSPIQTVWKRWEENNNNLTRSIVSKDLVQQTIDMFEEPTEQEGIIYVLQN